MRILHVIPYFAAAYGGPVQAVRDIARMQAESGIDVEIATSTANGAVELTAADRDTEIAGGATVRYFARTFPRGWFGSAQMRDWLLQHAADYDGLHLHVPFTAAMRYGVKAADNAGVPYAITPHGVLDPWSLAHKRWKKSPYLALVERAHLAGARLVHVTSALEERGLRMLGITDTLRRIPLAVSPPSNIRERNTLQPGLRLLFLSRLHPIKNLEALLAAIARCDQPSIRLTIAGDGDKHYVGQLHALVHELGIATAVTFAGHLKGDAKLQAWLAHDAFVLPSLHENFSLSTVEAMASGMPAIVSDQVGVADRIAATGAGLVIAGDDPSALADAITSMQDAGARQTAGMRARKLVENEFSTQVVRNAYAAFAAELTGKA